MPPVFKMALGDLDPQHNYSLILARKISSYQCVMFLTASRHSLDKMGHRVVFYNILYL